MLAAESPEAGLAAIELVDLENERTRPAETVFLINPDYAYQDFLREQHATLDKLNAAWGTDHRHWAEIPFSNQPPSHPAQRDDWSKYVTKWMAVRHVRFERTPSDAEFQRWMLQRYEIEGRDAEQIAGMLKDAFDKYCTSAQAANVN